MSRLEYLRVNPSIPGTGPSDHAHVIDLETFNALKDNEKQLKTTLTLWDAVATMLYNISPDTLDQFLDFSKNFKLVQCAKDESNKTLLVIHRRDHEVLVGTFEDHKGPGNFVWDLCTRCTIDTAGAWNIDYVSYCLHSSRDWDEVWDGKLKVVNPIDGNIAQSDDKRAKMAFWLAHQIMVEELWDGKWNRTVK